MFGSYWDKQSKLIATGFCLLAIFGLVLIAYFVGNGSGAQAEHEQQRTNHEQRDAQQRMLEACFKLPQGAAVECAMVKIASQVEAKDANADLKAQQDVALWAKIAGVLGMAQVVVSGVGLAALLRTIQQTELALAESRDANKIARASQEILERPYLTIVATKPPPKPEPFDCAKDLTYRIYNFGRSHAIVTHVAVVIEMVWPEGEDRFLDPEKVRGRAIGRGLVVPPSGESEPFQVTLKKDKGDEIHNLTSQGGYMHGFVRYEDAFGKRHVTGFTLLYAESGRRFHILVTHNKNANYSRSDEAAVRLAEPITETA